MRLQLGVATACSPDGCRVVTVEDDAMVDAQYAAPVQDRIKVRAGDLVALDVDITPPAIVWRWWHGDVLSVEPDSATVERAVSTTTRGGPHRAAMIRRIPAALAGALRTGDRVFFSDTEIIDLSRDGVPADPGRIGAERFAAIDAAYRDC
jgi:hypothetical protein